MRDLVIKDLGFDDFGLSDFPNGSISNSNNQSSDYIELPDHSDDDSPLFDGSFY